MSIDRKELSTLDFSDVSTGDRLSSIHPGEVLNEDFLKPLGISQSRLAADLGISFRRVNEIVLGKRSITAVTALLLGKYFDMSPGFWLGLQMAFDIEKAEQDSKEEMRRVRPFEKAS